MSDHTIAVDYRHTEVIELHGPDATQVWVEDIEDDAKGRHVLVLGSLDDALILTGKLHELRLIHDRIGQLLTSEELRGAEFTTERSMVVDLNEEQFGQLPQITGQPAANFGRFRRFGSGPDEVRHTYLNDNSCGEFGLDLVIAKLREWGLPYHYNTETTYVC